MFLVTVPDMSFYPLCSSHVFLVPVLQVPGDRQHQAGGDRRLEAPGGHARGGGQDRGVQEGGAGHLQLGDQGETRQGQESVQGQIPS